MIPFPSDDVTPPVTKMYFVVVTELDFESILIVCKITNNNCKAEL